MSLRYHREAQAELDEALAFYAGQHVSLPGAFTARSGSR